MPAEKPFSSTGGYELAPLNVDGINPDTLPGTVIAGSAPVKAVGPLPVQVTLQRAWWLTPLMAWLVVMLCVNLATQIAFHSPLRSDFRDSWAFHPGWSPHQHALIRWDAIRYWQIAHGWYRVVNIPVGTANTANYPGYPAMVYVLCRVIPLPVWLWLLLISNAASVVATILLYRLTAEIFPDQPMAPMLAVLGFLLEPQAIFLFAGYTEPLFDLLIMLFFFAMLRRRWGIAAGLGAVADLVRPTGVVCAATLFVVLLGLAARDRQSRGQAVGRAILWPAVAASGFILWAVWLAWETGDPLMVLHIQRWVHVGLTWQHTLLALDIGKTFHRILADIASPANPSHITALENACVLLTPLVVLAMLLPKVRLPQPLVLTALFLWLLPFLSHSQIHYQGMGRYQLATSIPLWIFFGAVFANLPRRTAWVVVPLLLFSAAWMVFLAMRFAQGFWTG